MKTMKSRKNKKNKSQKAQQSFTERIAKAAGGFKERAKSMNSEEKAEQVQQPVPLLRKLVRKAAQDALLFRRDMLQAQRGHRKCLIR